MRQKPPSKQSVHAPAKDTCPAGRWRLAVRGFALSKWRSTIRLNDIAQVRAQTKAARIKPKVRQPGQPRWSRAATTMEASAKGSAKTVWDSLTKEAHFLITENIEPCTLSTANIQHRTSNIEHSTSNIQHRTPNIEQSVGLAGWVGDRCAGSSLLNQRILQRRLDARHKNANQLVRLVQDKKQCRIILCPVLALDQSRPTTRFAKFLEANRQLMDELFTGFGGLRLAMIWKWGRAGTQNLSGDVISRACFGQSFGQVNHCRSELEQSVLPIEFSSARAAFAQ